MYRTSIIVDQLTNIHFLRNIFCFLQRRLASSRHMAGGERLHMASGKTKQIWIADFDETISVADTTQLIILAAYQKNCHLPPIDKYLGIYLEAVANYNRKTTDNLRSTIQDEIDYQKGMKPVEWSSVGAIEQDGIFKGVTRDDFRELASQVDLRPGFSDFAAVVSANHLPFYVLSVNWSASMIRKVLENTSVESAEIIANDLLFDSDGVATGSFDPNFDIRTSYDKLVWLNHIRAAHPDATIVYIGDSSGDVLPMVHSDYGILISGGRGYDALSKLNMAPAPLGSHLEKNKVYSATWEELVQRWGEFR